MEVGKAQKDCDVICANSNKNRLLRINKYELDMFKGSRKTIGGKKLWGDV